MGARSEPVVVEARAKLNLGLAVGPLRPDGFHELATIFQSVSLSDTLTATRRRSGFTIRVRYEHAAARGRLGPEHRERVPADRNLVVRAARAVADRHGLRHGAHFELIKRIPQRAGLGGGSVDAAAAIVAMERLYGLPRRRDRVALAASIGSDVPFALSGGTALGRGRGERLRRLRLARPFRALIAVPKWSVSTPRAFRAIDRNRNHLTGWRSKLRFATTLSRSSLIPERAMSLGNTFEAVLERRREWMSLKTRLTGAGADTVRLTGSGSAVIGLLPRGERPAAALRRFEGDEALYLVRSVGRGLTIVTRS